MTKIFLSTIAALFASILTATAQDIAAESTLQPEKQTTVPANVFKASIGPSLIYSKVYLPSRVYKRHGALDFDLTYQHVWRKGWGIGVNYALNVANYHREFLITQNYIGASAVYAVSAKRWRVDMTWGVGYSQYAERIKYYDYQYRVRKAKGTEAGWGMYTHVGAEYMITQHFGIGAQITSLASFYRRPEGVELPEDEPYGIKRANLLIGPRVYF